MSESPPARKLRRILRVNVIVNELNSSNLKKYFAGLNRYVVTADTLFHRKWLKSRSLQSEQVTVTTEKYIKGGVDAVSKETANGEAKKALIFFLLKFGRSNTNMCEDWSVRKVVAVKADDY